MGLNCLKEEKNAFDNLHPFRKRLNFHSKQFTTLVRQLPAPLQKLKWSDSNPHLAVYKGHEESGHLSRKQKLKAINYKKCNDWYKEESKRMNGIHMSLQKINYRYLTKVRARLVQSWGLGDKFSIPSPSKEMFSSFPFLVSNQKLCSNCQPIS